MRDEEFKGHLGRGMIYGHGKSLQGVDVKTAGMVYLL